MKTSDVLNRAADLIEERGWAGLDVPSDEAWGRDSMTTPICIEGGIMAALDLKWTFEVEACDAYRAVQSHVGLRKGQRLWVFNDTYGRTASEVIEVLRACAVIEAAREDQEAAWETYAESVTA